MYEEKSYFCPLVDRDMWDAECYDVQMVHYGFIKPEILDFTLDKVKARNLCESCSFNQLKQPASYMRKQVPA